MTTPAAPSPTRGRAWIALVVALLAAVVASNVILMRVASADPSVAFEPDAYRKGSRWDESVAEARRSEALGWTATLESSRDPETGLLSGRMRLMASAHPVSDARVEIEGFAVARSGERHRLEGSTDADGVAFFTVHPGRPGLWEWRLRARRGDQVFVKTFRETVRDARP